MYSGKIDSALRTITIAKYANGVYFLKLTKGSGTKTL